ncbi:TPA: pentapeptide repeat-containing protein, partial [Salmonella enterica subsp. enterica serovar Typhimurium]
MGNQNHGNDCQRAGKTKGYIVGLLLSHFKYLIRSQCGLFYCQNLRNNNMNSADLSKILEEHKVWITSMRESGSRADLRDTNLRGANLRDADLRGADLRDADLRGADL